MIEKYNNINLEQQLNIIDIYKHITNIKDVINDYSAEELIEAIGLDKVEIILRKKKLEKIKLDIK